MPHSIFLGSALATQDRVSESSSKLTQIESTSTVDSETTVVSLSRIIPRLSDLKGRITTVFRAENLQEKMEPKSHAEHDNNAYTFVRAHIYHGTIDIALSLLGLAVVINSLSVIPTVSSCERS